MLLCLTVFMRTTVDIPDNLFKRIKVTASLNGITLKQFITKAIEHEVEAQSLAFEHKKVSLPLVPSKHPGSIALSSDKIAKLLEYEDLHGLT